MPITNIAKTAYPHITTDPRMCGGSACIDNTRIRVIDIAIADEEGHRPDQIRDLFAVRLSLAQIHSALAYADEHPVEIAADTAEQARVGIDGQRAREEYLRRHVVEKNR